ncbi:MAG TPA: hypothetical protein ENJ56_05730, partial [Anaerolineae bacterium]|nr:hypothetical protein [Anaerolineae bacterium]
MNKKYPLTYMGLFALLFLLLIGARARSVQAEESVWVSAEYLPNNLTLQVARQDDFLLRDQSARLYIAARSGQDNYVLRYTSQGVLQGGFHLGSNYTYQFGVDQARGRLLIDRSDGLLDIYDYLGRLIKQIELPSGFGAQKPARPQSYGTGLFFAFRGTTVLIYDAETFEFWKQDHFDLTCDGQPTVFEEAYVDTYTNFFYLVYPWKGCGSNTVQYKVAAYDQRHAQLRYQVELGTEH